MDWYCSDQTCSLLLWAITHNKAQWCQNGLHWWLQAHWWQSVNIDLNCMLKGYLIKVVCSCLQWTAVSKLAAQSSCFHSFTRQRMILSACYTYIRSGISKCSEIGVWSWKRRQLWKVRKCHLEFPAWDYHRRESSHKIFTLFKSFNFHIALFHLYTSLFKTIKIILFAINILVPRIWLLKEKIVIAGSSKLISSIISMFILVKIKT